jgi:hypothetical protein
MLVKTTPGGGDGDGEGVGVDGGVGEGDAAGTTRGTGAVTTVGVGGNPCAALATQGSIPKNDPAMRIRKLGILRQPFYHALRLAQVRCIEERLR